MFVLDFYPFAGALMELFLAFFFLSPTNVPRGLLRTVGFEIPYGYVVTYIQTDAVQEGIILWNVATSFVPYILSGKIELLAQMMFVCVHPQKNALWVCSYYIYIHQTSPSILA